MRRIVLFAALALSAAGLASAAGSPRTSPVGVGDVAPDFTLAGPERPSGDPLGLPRPAPGGARLLPRLLVTFLRSAVGRAPLPPQGR